VEIGAKKQSEKRRKTAEKGGERHGEPIVNPERFHRDRLQRTEEVRGCHGHARSLKGVSERRGRRSSGFGKLIGLIEKKQHKTKEKGHGVRDSGFKWGLPHRKRS